MNDTSNSDVKICAMKNMCPQTNGLGGLWYLF